MVHHPNFASQIQAAERAIDNGFFPFPTQLNLKLAIDYWRKYAKEDHFFHSKFSGRFEQILQQHPFLLEPIKDSSVLHGQEEFLEMLFEPILPRNGWSNTILSVATPFMLHPPIAATDNFYNLLGVEKTRWDILDSPPDQESLNCRTLGAYRAILHKFYHLMLPFDFPITIVYTNLETGLSRYFKGTGTKDFISIHKLGALPKLSRHALQQLAEQPFDFYTWEKLLPPENFLFSGVNIFSLLDVTTEEASTRLQRILLERWDGNEASQFQCMEREIRNLFKVADLRLGVASLKRNGEINFNSAGTLWNSLLLREAGGNPIDLIRGSVYEKVLQTGKLFIAENLEKQAGSLGPAERALVALNCRNLVVVPLLFDNQPVGIIELTSPTPGGVHALSLLKINHIRPVFAHALKRHRDEFENKVEAAMMERYTAIHPAIQWRFRDATIRQFDPQVQGITDEDILFENIFPFYGSLDIRSSSDKRNRAVHRDLLDNLGTAKSALQAAFDILAFSVLGELAFKTGQKLQKLREAFNSGDEPSVAEFIRREINPVLHHIRRNYPQTAAAVDVYLDNLHPESGVFTNNRRAYEEALMLINQTAITVLDEEEDALQNLYPCYFEKYKTDGVEYNIYTGASIAPNREFDLLYLDNIRLRQLSWTCKIMRKIDSLQPHIRQLLTDAHCITSSSGCDQLPPADTCLEIAPLILAFGSPITLRFRMDEKRLDVDGSYNIRYEIIKKRIDKAIVKGTQERLTQPGHISIVYARPKEAQAFRSHLEYLAAQDYLQPAYEDLELEALQGVEGLRALRVKV